MDHPPTLLPGFLAPRAARAVRPALSYFKAFLDAKERQWTPEDPDGNIILSVAENRLSADLVKDKLAQATEEVPLDAMGYQDMKGLPRLRRAMAKLLENTFMKGIRVEPDDLAVCAGAGAVLKNLFHCIASAGDAVLIPAPYYPAFDNDLQVKLALQPWPFALDEDKPIGPQLDAAAEAAEHEPPPPQFNLLPGAAPPPPHHGSSGDGDGSSTAGRRRRVAALLFTSPNNPLGIMYRRETIVGFLRWCLRRCVHVVSDEIYGNSVFGEGKRYTSAEVVARQEAAALPHPERLPQLLHVVWGMSKDFCASGLRVGCLHSRNTQLNKAMDNLCYFTAVPNTVQLNLAAALEDEAWVTSFIAENTARLASAYAKLEAALAAAGIPHVRADSAMFCWLDLRRWLQEATWEGENQLWEDMCGLGVLLTPGKQCHAPAPGYFRCCWAWSHPDALPAAVARLVGRFGGQAPGAEGGEEPGQQGQEGGLQGAA